MSHPEIVQAFFTAVVLIDYCFFCFCFCFRAPSPPGNPARVEDACHPEVSRVDQAGVLGSGRSYRGWCGPVSEAARQHHHQAALRLD